MKGLSEKVYLSLNMPTEELPLSDHRRITLALEALGYAPVTVPLSVLQRLHPMCRDSGFDITVTLVHQATHWVLTHAEPGDCRRRHCGLAVDYGSTTIVMELVDLTDGKTVARATEVNGQTAYGADILSRITYTKEAPEHVRQMQQATVETFHSLMDQLQQMTGFPVRSCPVMVLSGNTTMIHFLLGLDAWTVFAAPYAPVTANPGMLWGWELGMAFQGLIYVVPAASNYIGGDILSGLMKLQLHKGEQVNMFFDIGTNGELVIGNRHWMLAGAGAAGPALEGYISRYGMRAAPGAVDTVKIEGKDLAITTIGGERPRGICGSGIMDLLAQMRLQGWINIAGTLEPAASDRICWLAEENQYAVVYATQAESHTGEPLFFTQTDIRQYLDTKAAAYTMVECLLEAAGCEASQLEHIWLSGAFTAHSDLESAITIGLFPDLPRQRYKVVPNTSLEGARAILLDRSLVREAEKLAEEITCVQFASIPDFLVRMQAAKFIPPHPYGAISQYKKTFTRMNLVIQ